MKIVLAEAGGKGVDSGESAATIHLGVWCAARLPHTANANRRWTDYRALFHLCGADYPGIGPIHAHLAETGRAQVVAITDDEALRAAYELPAMRESSLR